VTLLDIPIYNASPDAIVLFNLKSRIHFPVTKLVDVVPLIAIDAEVTISPLAST
jgi:hypothetical protein